MLTATNTLHAEELVGFEPSGQSMCIELPMTALVTCWLLRAASGTVSNAMWAECMEDADVDAADAEDLHAPASISAISDPTLAP